MATKHCKSIEVQLQEKLYENVHLLTQIYQPTEEFKVHFKADMFSKNNKAGFYQVVYYLLNVLNPELTKKKITAWPPYEIRLETKYRSEVIQYISEINSLYEDANIPVLMTSHLISPGGVKFLKFMFKLSQLVLLEHLKKSARRDRLIYPPKGTKAHNASSAYIKNVKGATNIIEERTRVLYDTFLQNFSALKEKASEIINKKSKINISLAEISETYKKIQESSALHISPPLLEIKDKIEILQKELENVQKLKTKLETTEGIISFLFEEKNIFHIKRHNTEVNGETEQIFNPQDNKLFDFVQFLHMFHTFLDRTALQLPHLPPGYFLEIKQKIDEMSNQYYEIYKHAEKIYEDFMKKVEGKQGVGAVFDIAECDLSDLAVSLDDTDDPSGNCS